MEDEKVMRVSSFLTLIGNYRDTVNVILIFTFNYLNQ